MKRWQKITLALVLAVTVWMVVGFWIVGTADCVVRVSFTGLNNIFHVPFEYYVVRDGDAVRIPRWVAVFGAPEIISGSKYEDEHTAQWFTRLSYWKRYGIDPLLDRSGSWLPTEFGEKYRIYYENWGGPKIDAGSDVQAVMQQAAQYFHDGDINKMSSFGSTGERGLTWFIVVSNGERILVQHQEDALYLPVEDGTFRLLMECPKGGRFDYFWFP
jgi:hypothetical protein